MFEKLKDLKKAQEMQRAFAQEKHTVEEKGIKVTVNGNLQVEEIVVAPEIEQAQIGALATEVINRAFREIQQKLAQQLMG